MREGTKIGVGRRERTKCGRGIQDREERSKGIEIRIADAFAIIKLFYLCIMNRESEN